MSIRVSEPLLCFARCLLLCFVDVDIDFLREK